MTNQSDYDYGDYGDYGDYNDSDLVEPCSHQNAHSVWLVVAPYVYSIICILGLVGNGLVIATYAFYKRTRSMTDVYLLNVAVADLLFVASLPLIVYNELWAWPMGPVACKLLRGSYSVNLYSGTLLLACISTDRYLAIVQACRGFRLRLLPYSRLICAAVWSAALLLSVPTFYFYNWYVDVCEFQFADNAAALWRCLQLAVGFFLPLLVMVLCYSAIVATLLRARTFRRQKAVWVVLAVAVVFVVCHLPYNAMLLYDTAAMFQVWSCKEAYVLQTAKTVTQTLAYLHCCLNPVLYAVMGVEFRNHFRRVVLGLCCLGKRNIASPQRFFRVASEIYGSGRRSVDGSSENGSSFTM